MNQHFSDPFSRRLKAARSRRELFAMATRGTVGGLGAALIARGVDLDRLGGLGSVALAQDASVSIMDDFYDPQDLTVTVGSTVTWTNDGGSGHTVTATPDPNVFFSPEIAPTMSFTHTFDTAGTFDYFCQIHGMSMSGTITVVEGGTPEPTRPYVRPNVNLLEPDGPELKAYALAVKEMKLLPATDGRSWLSQAYTHWAYEDDVVAAFQASGMPVADFIALITERAWLTCEHGTLFFWPWHRMFLYWFEQVVREMSGFADFALPYWDYTNPAQRILPAPFRDTTNALFAPRDSAVNAGIAPTLSTNAEASLFGICHGLTLANFASATAELESTPHDQVHLWVGGAFANPEEDHLMRHVESSAQDPVFWMHHANLDRLWESWLRAGNMNPPAADWQDHDRNDLVGVPYNFVDGAGNLAPKFRVVKEVLSTTAMGYEYQELVDLTTCAGFVMGTPGPEAAVHATPAAAHTGGHASLELGSNSPPERIELGASPTTVPIAIQQPEAALEAAAPEGGGRTILTLDDVSGEGGPGVLFQIYINLPSGQEPAAASPYFVGTVSLFGLGVEDRGLYRAHKAMQTFDISRNVEALDARGEWTGDVEVTFVPVRIDTGAPPEAAAAASPAAEPPGPWVTIGSVALAVQ